MQRVIERERNTIPGCKPPGKSVGHAPVYEPRADKYIQAIRDYIGKVINERSMWRRMSERKLKSE